MVKEPPELALCKPCDLKKSDFNSQVCMRCNKAPAVEDEIFCQKCLDERARIEEITKQEHKGASEKPVVKIEEVLFSEKDVDED